MTSPPLSVAVLFRGLRWSIDSESFDLAPGMSLCKFKGSSVANLYASHCNEPGLVDEDPDDDYEVYVKIESASSSWYTHCDDPFSDVNRLSNVIAIMTSKPISVCRVVWSSDRFRSVDGTSLVCSCSGNTYCFLWAPTTITGEMARQIGVAWKNYQAAWERHLSGGWLMTALTGFQYAWRSFYADQTCLNLGIALEALYPQLLKGNRPFPPIDQSPDKATHMLDFIREIRSIRATVVRGDMSEEIDNRMIVTAIEAFPFTASVLERVLLDGTIPAFPRPACVLRGTVLQE